MEGCTPKDDVPGGYLTVLDPQGSSRPDIPTRPETAAACAAGVVTVTAGRDGSRCRYHGN